MKVRQSFVTNSSSSSFILIGKKVFSDEINLNDGYDYYGVGSYVCEGLDVFQIDEDILNEIKKAESGYLFNTRYLNFYRAYQTSYDDPVANFKLDLGKLNKVPMKDRSDIDVVSVEKDYHGTETVNDFIRRYIDED